MHLPEARDVHYGQENYAVGPLNGVKETAVHEEGNGPKYSQQENNGH